MDGDDDERVPLRLLQFWYHPDGSGSVVLFATFMDDTTPVGGEARSAVLSGVELDDIVALVGRFASDVRIPQWGEAGAPPLTGLGGALAEASRIASEAWKDAAE